MLLCQAMFTAMGMLACPPTVAATLMHAVGAAHATGGPSKADWIRWIGVGTAVLGALVVALAALDLVWFQVRQLPHRADGLLRRLYTGPAPAQTVSAGAMLATGGTMSGEANVRPGADAPLDVLVHHLMQEVDRLRDRIREQERKQRADQVGLSARMDKIDRDIRASLQSLAARTEQDRRQDVRLAARALPLIILGTIMTGVPDGLAAAGWVGWALAGLSIVLALWLGVWPVGDWPWHKVHGSWASVGTADEAPAVPVATGAEMPAANGSSATGIAVGPPERIPVLSHELQLIGRVGDYSMHAARWRGRQGIRAVTPMNREVRLLVAHAHSTDHPDGVPMARTRLARRTQQPGPRLRT